MTLSVRIRHRQGDFTLDVDVEAPSGVTALFGRSGSGKTTIVNAVAGLLTPDSGRIRVAGRTLLDRAQGINVPPHARRLGYVFQDGRLFPHLSVAQNLRYGRWFSRNRPGAKEMAQVIEMLGIGGLLDRRPAGLSGGEQQRVAIGRALLSGPELLLMDEPLAALDDARRAEILPYIQRLRDESAIPILYVSHSVAEVARIATTVIAIEAGQVMRVGAARDILSDPEVAPALGIREAGALISGVLAAHHADGISELRFSGGTLFLPRQPEPLGARLRVRIEAKDVVLATERPVGLSALNILPATIQVLRQGEGPGVLVQLRVGDDRLLCRLTRRSADRLALAPGQACFAVLKSVSVAKEDIG
jgi:molybdate transport system ATP-binding protein